jgi:hypothetical protein
VVTLIPLSVASLVVVRLLTGADGLNLDFSIFNFHVPSELSAAIAPIAVTTKPIVM